MSSTRAVPSPSWLALHPNGSVLYAVNEISNFTTSPASGSVTAFAINRGTGDLTMLQAIAGRR